MRNVDEFMIYISPSNNFPDMPLLESYDQNSRTVLPKRGMSGLKPWWPTQSD